MFYKPKINTKDLLQAVINSSVDVDKSTLTTLECTTTPHAAISFVCTGVRINGFYYSPDSNKNVPWLQIIITERFNWIASLHYYYDESKDLWKLSRKKSSVNKKASKSTIAEINSWSKHSVMFIN